MSNQGNRILGLASLGLGIVDLFLIAVATVMIGFGSIADDSLAMASIPATPVPVDVLSEVVPVVVEEVVEPTPCAPGYLGVVTEPSNVGLKVTIVEDGSPAYHVGIQVNDVIYKVASMKFGGNVEGSVNYVPDFCAGDEVKMTIVKNREVSTIFVTLGER